MSEIESIMEGFARKDEKDLSMIKLLVVGMRLGADFYEVGIDIRKMSEEDAIEQMRKQILEIYLKSQKV